jgi:hypothetical protein
MEVEVALTVDFTIYANPLPPLQVGHLVSHSLYETTPRVVELNLQ